MPDNTAIAHCLPEKLHPVSQMFLDAYMNGKMTTAEFSRWFHMPDSDYLDVGQCVIHAIAGTF